jgi:hypothetical protein
LHFHLLLLLAPPGPLPWAVFEVASGRLLLRQELLQALASSPAQASAVLVNAGTAGLQHLLQQIKVRPGQARWPCSASGVLCASWLRTARHLHLAHLMHT